MSFELSMRVFELSKCFPIEERYSLTDQLRRSSRSVSANIAEGWRKRRYKAAFVSKLSDAEAELAETQVWLAYAARCQYGDAALIQELDGEYEALLGSIVGMILHADAWCRLMPPHSGRRSTDL